MFFDSLQQRMKRKLDGLNFDFENFSIDALVKHLEATRGRFIKFIPQEFPPDLHGGWITSKDYKLEYIFLNKALPPLQLEHTKLHELSHIICSHKTLAVGEHELKELRESEALLLLLWRTQKTKSDIEEKEAETMAVMLQALAHNNRPEIITSSSEAGKSYLSSIFDGGKR